FLAEMATRPCVSVYSVKTDLAVVEIYERVYQERLISLEITKPSEQTFKALVSPKQRGGALLLFSEPVGRQERDNLAFLERHQLVPTPTDQRQMWDMAARGVALDPDEGHLLGTAQRWRGVRVPADPVAAAQYILWSLQQGIFKRMLDGQLIPRTQ